MSQNMCVGQNQNMMVVDTSFENVAKFKNL